MDDGQPTPTRKPALANPGRSGGARRDLKKTHADSWPSSSSITSKRTSLPASPKIIKTTEDDVGDVFDYRSPTPVTTPSTVELDYVAISPRFERKRFEFCYPSVSKEDFSNSISIDTHDIDRAKKRIYPSKTPDNSLENESILDGSMASCSSPGHSSSAVTRTKSPSVSPRHSRRQLNSETINIISNPGYQVLRNSHSTLDRTCSDSVVSLVCRKSTSDLTQASDAAMMIGVGGGGGGGGRPGRRRSSHKGGGLAFLASRKGSRDSIKSACGSNASVFSNEDLGPLAFQASARGRQRRTSNFLELPVPDHARPRVCSLPERPYNPRQSDDLYRLRHFSISKGTVVNCGDSIISRRSKSNTSVNSTASRASERSPFEGSCCGGGYATVDSLPSSHGDEDDESEPIPTRYRVVMLGDSGVGKTALVSQFMTSEYMHTYDASLDDEFGEKTVSVLLDTEESEMIFIDHPNVEMSVENSLSTYEPHACVVVYSIVDRNSFRVAEEILNYLWSEHYTKEKAVIIAANKSDLARARVITTAEGKHLATSREAKFIETSSGIQHNVDELLVGVLKQIRLKEQREKRASATNLRNSRTQMSLHIAKEILHKICLTDITKSKSCENLHVL
ncbi:arf-GAP with ANK repeat and PH domain-containing protein cnt-2-like [Anopheles bellator]|uniref:arf-GAP with ANK repeat and PH domain-containing protein cnt-2-like n=1 Tax=Anopheles bellator TaxID=139047 RepID=UPI0026494DD4|nr:arf-GAP with ANK repeat and PH domain-containing protein cnt-2-like [Anopheles bellator]